MDMFRVAESSGVDPRVSGVLVRPVGDYVLGDGHGRVEAGHPISGDVARHRYWDGIEVETVGFLQSCARRGTEVAVEVDLERRLKRFDGFDGHRTVDAIDHKAGCSVR
ncbi:MAG: hypothetical protein UY52_C0012G0018 [Parcubacteria group bacterium GW2011_GWC2_49_9]|nr:MAG: hypothetical protein UY34_C0023G0008 [Parcubacteria group bacterium GW2011_GWA2_48_9]KKW15931.1 MAG: hypothetical protein UY52_C0012G0018 [Parcubacteria group bacterium GW2011_GWC2_49_9]